MPLSAAWLAEHGRSPLLERQLATNGRVDAELVALMAAPRFPGRAEPEQALSCQVAGTLRRLTLKGRLRCVWRAVDVSNMLGGRGAMTAQVKGRAMGAVAGLPDFAFWWRGGGGLVELKVAGGEPVLAVANGRLKVGKTAPGRLRPAQKQFAGWCNVQGVPCEVARSVAEVLAILERWGQLK